jgi:hypothetical protein
VCTGRERSCPPRVRQLIEEPAVYISNIRRRSIRRNTAAFFTLDAVFPVVPFLVCSFACPILSS